MGDVDDYLEELLHDKTDSFGVVSGVLTGGKMSGKSTMLSNLQKEILFGQHYGMGTQKLEDMMVKYSEADVKATQAFSDHLKYLKAKAEAKAKQKYIGHLFLGGPEHGKRHKTDGQWVVKVPVPGKQSEYLATWSMDDAPVGVGYTVVSYVRQKIMLPGSNYAEVYVLDDPKMMGTGQKDQLIAQHMLNFFSTHENEVNTPVLPPPPEPVKPAPVEDGIKITIGGKTIEWTADAAQLSGLLSWAAQSLGPGKETQ